MHEYNERARREVYGFSEGTGGREGRYGEHWTRGKRVGRKKGGGWDGEACVSEDNVLFSPPTGPRGFLGYPSVVCTLVYAIVLPAVRMWMPNFVRACMQAGIWMMRKTGTIRWSVLQPREARCSSSDESYHVVRGEKTNPFSLFYFNVCSQSRSVIPAVFRFSL